MTESTCDETDPGLEVLVVDDEPRLADLFAAWLADDCSVSTAYDGEQALERIDDSIDLLLLDRRMPGLSGDEVLERVRDDGYEGWIVMVTAIELDLEIMGEGYDEYLVKPISKRQLTDLVTEVSQQIEAGADASSERCSSGPETI